MLVCWQLSVDAFEKPLNKEGSLTYSVCIIYDIVWCNIDNSHTVDKLSPYMETSGKHINLI